MKRLIFQNPMFTEAQSHFGTAHLKEILLESLFVLAACLLWVAILPIYGVFCVGIGAYDKVASLHWAKYIQVIFAKT